MSRLQSFVQSTLQFEDASIDAHRKAAGMYDVRSVLCELQRLEEPRGETLHEECVSGGDS